jgi:hypothetical protein
MCFSDSLTGVYEEKEIHSMTWSASILRVEKSLCVFSARNFDSLGT